MFSVVIRILEKLPRTRRAPGGAHAIRRAPESAARSMIESLEPRELLAANPIVRPDHIVIVWEQDRASNAIGNPIWPYLNQLASSGLVYSNAHGVTHPSEPNTLAFYSGSTQNI